MKDFKRIGSRHSAICNTEPSNYKKNIPVNSPFYRLSGFVDPSLLVDIGHSLF
jgi:hypothetical protein